MEWNEWWYPIHGIGGFTFANKDVAVNASVDGGKLRLRMLGSGAWAPVKVRLQDEQGNLQSQAESRLSPKESAQVELEMPAGTGPREVELVAGDTTLARFTVPLTLPARTPPGPKPKVETPAEIANAGWEDYYSPAMMAPRQNSSMPWRKTLA